MELERYRFFQKLTSLPFIEVIYLYGSRARNDHNPRSDIDLAVVCPKASRGDWQQVMEIIEEADTLLKIDCIRLDLISSQQLKENIMKQGRIVYKK
ncbi:MAG: nucleotidyltransferase domain-containing protein [Waddliaceae bacterium]